MSMSTYVYGFRPPDERWTAMKAIWDACQAAQIAPPVEVDEFFDGEAPDAAGVKVDLIEGSELRPYSGDGEEGYEILIRDLPPNIHILRFVNSW